MKTLIATMSCSLLCFGPVRAEAPPMQVPPAPEISAAKAVELAAAYVATALPKDSNLYCQSVQLQDGGMRPVRAYRHWELVYRHAGAVRSVDEKSGKETFGDFHVYVTMTGEVSQEPRVEVRELKRKEDKVEVSIHDDTLFVDATSPGGIGSTRLALTSGIWPKKVVLRLKYAADKPFTILEGLGATLEQTDTKADESPLKLDAQRLTQKNGFEADLPATEMKVLHLDWIDAYRH